MIFETGTYDRVKVKLLQKVMSNRIQFAWRIYKARMQYRYRKAELIQQTAASITLQQWMKVILWRIQQKRNKYKQAALVSIQAKERASRNESTAVLISIPLPSFKSVPLYL